MPALDLVSRDLRSLALGEAAVEYVLVRRRGRRGVGLKVDETGLTVSAPATMPLVRIEALVRESERWVLRKVAEWGKRRVPAASWHDGAAMPYLGAAYALRRLAGARARTELVAGELRVATPTGSDAEVIAAVVSWYKRSARAHFEARVAELVRCAGLTPPRLMLSSALSRWGSCNSRREVRLAWRLVKAPRELVDYVICHELAHLRHMNHSTAFWAEVQRQCPDFQRLREALFATDHIYRAF